MNDNNNQWAQGFDDLSLPDKEAAWKKMESLLDEGESKRRPVPFFLRSWIGLALLAIVIGAGAWFVFVNQHSSSTKLTSTNSSTPSATSTANDKSLTKQEQASPLIIPSQPDANNRINTGSPASTTSAASATSTNALSTSSNQTADPGLPSADDNHNCNNGTTKSVSVVRNKAYPSPQKPSAARKPHSTANDPQAPDINSDRKKQQHDRTGSASNDDKDPNGNSGSEAATDSRIRSITLPRTIKPVKVLSVLHPVFTPVVITASPAQQPTVVKTTNKRFSVSAGIGLQQQIPMMGQKAVPYDYYGRRNSISDYLPSAYVRFQRNGKWFVLGEFRYGAPQALHEFSYSRKTSLDTSTLTVTTLRLKKTYYHQFPISFNYFVKPSFSIGTGVVYSRFFGAVSEREVRNRNLQNQTETLSKSIVQIKEFTDSFLYRSQLHVLFQANYDWRRFSFGLRYTKDLQPYIKYTQPDGMINQRRNQTLQGIVRFRIF